MNKKSSYFFVESLLLFLSLLLSEDFALSLLFLSDSAFLAAESLSLFLLKINLWAMFYSYTTQQNNITQNLDFYL